MQDFRLPLFFAMFGLLIVWLVLVLVLFAKIKSNHPKMYQLLGGPNAFEGKATQVLLSFLFSRKPESLQDSRLLMHTNIMRALLVVYVIGLALIMYLAMNQARP